jgi:mono/diheme cytochrome c family protein
MALWKKVVLATFALALLVLAVGVQAVVGWRALLFGPSARALTERTFERTPERTERGRYLAQRHNCIVCHSERDWKEPGAPPVAERLGAGVVWTTEGMPWLTASNLTPDPETGLGRVSDDAIARAIREGVGADGRALFAIMPYQEYRRLPDEDVAAIVAYLRSLPPVQNPLPKSALPFPLGLIMRGVPRPLDGPVPPPDLSTPEKRGEYVLRTSACHHCHSPIKGGEPSTELDMAGGNMFESPAGAVAATNVTPDPTGIAHYDEATFVQVMRTGKLGNLSPAMPWVVSAGMTDEDLRAVFAYLRTLKPVKHVVTNGQPPTDCPVCGLKHGGGERNRP